MVFESSYCRKVSWEEVSSRVKAVKPELFQIIEEIKPSDRFGLYLVKYPYGSSLLDHGNLFLPDNHGEMVPIKSDSISADIRKDLDYEGTIPLSLLLSKSAEIFIQPESSRVMPFGITSPGGFFGVWQALGEQAAYLTPKVWSITSGGRSVFMLPKISDSLMHEKLCRERKFNFPPPKNLLEEWQIFKEIAKKSDAAKDWNTEVLYFARPWVQNQKKLTKLHYYLLESAWRSSEYWRNKIIFDSIWDFFVKELTKINIKSQGYIIDIVKHIITVGLGILPGFYPALDEEILPLKAIQNDYIDIYGLKKFYPTILVPHHLRSDDERPIYWSFQLNNYFETIPRPKSQVTILKDIENAISTLDKFCSSMKQNKINYIADSRYEDFINNIDYTFFHSDIFPGSAIQSTSVLPKEDPSFLAGKKNFPFPEQAAFIRGCVKLKRIKHK